MTDEKRNSFTLDPEADKYLKMARTAQEQRRNAPPVDVHSVLTIPQKDIIEKFAPECVEKVHYERTAGKLVRIVDKAAEYHPFFGHKNDSEKFALQGYEPVLFQGKHVHYEEDRLWRLPLDLHKRNEDLNIQISKAKLGEIEDSSKGRNPIVSEEVTKIVRPGEEYSGD